MKLEDVYSLLAPEDAEISRMADKEIRDAKEFVRKLNIVSTAAKNDDEDKEDIGKEMTTSGTALDYDSDERDEDDAYGAQKELISMTSDAK